MNCTFETLLACFQLSGFFVDASLIHANHGEGVLVSETHTEYMPQKPGSKFPMWKDVTTYGVDYSARNPYARFELGYDVQWNAKWSTRMSFSHESSIATSDDRGAERFELGVTWRPFAR